jgi:hypothetical protein
VIRESLVGEVLGRVRLPVEAGKIREFASAIRDFNPVYRDPVSAAAAGFSGIPAPPTFSATVNHVPDEELQNQGGVLEVLGLDQRRVLGGEQSWTYLRPLVAGDVLVGEQRVESIDRKQGRAGGEMVFVTIATTFKDDRDSVVLIHRNTIIETATSVGG